MLKLLCDFEQDMLLSSTEAAKFLGVAYSTYAAWKNQSRELPPYIARSVRFACNLQEPFLSRLIREILHGDK